jgi:hypothetical protein
VKAAAVLVAVEGGEWEHPFTQYKALVNQDYSAMTPIAQAYTAQVLYGVSASRRHSTIRALTREGAFLRGVKAMDPRYADASLLMIRDMAQWAAAVRGRIKRLVERGSPRRRSSTPPGPLSGHVSVF